MLSEMRIQEANMIDSEQRLNDQNFNEERERALRGRNRDKMTAETEEHWW